MDVVNGKIVSSNSNPGRSNSDLWGAPKPLRSSAVDGMAGPYPQGNPDQLAGSYSSLRERMDWAGPSGLCSSGAVVSHSWGASMAASHGRGTTMASSMSAEHGAGRWSRSARDNILGQPHKQFAAAPSFAESPLLHSAGRFSSRTLPGATDPQPGWKVPNSGAYSGRGFHSARSYTRAEGRAALDKEMNSFESQLCRAISGQLEIPDSAAEDLGLEAHAGADHIFKRQQMEEVSENEVEGAEAVTDKKQKVELSEDDQDESSWIAPLQFLVRKVLSVSDVGTLGRIVLPKKDAEVQLPLIDTKEGKLLEMEDYSISKRWSFRYKSHLCIPRRYPRDSSKQWPPVLSFLLIGDTEAGGGSTTRVGCMCWRTLTSKLGRFAFMGFGNFEMDGGEFIRHHCLKEHDSFIMYKDGCGKLVVRGQKKTIPHSDSAIIPSKQVASSNVENPANSDGPLATTPAEDD